MDYKNTVRGEDGTNYKERETEKYRERTSYRLFHPLTDNINEYRFPFPIQRDEECKKEEGFDSKKKAKN